MAEIEISKTSPPRASDDADFFGRSVMLLAVIVATALAGGHLVGTRYKPQPLAPLPERVASADHFVAVFGNSRTEAGIDPKQLATTLSSRGRNVDAQSFTGGGWDMLQYQMLALLSAQVLRPGRDAVLLEVSVNSLDDAVAGNRLGVIRPETAWPLASLPGEPLETRLDILMGAVAGLYRYRVSLQSMALAPRLASTADRVGGLMGAMGLLRAPPEEPPFRLVTAPGRGFVIQEIKGDRSVFREVNRARLRESLQRVKLGGFKMRALERSVRALRDRGVAVYLVQIPTSRWYDDLVDSTEAGRAYRAMIPPLAERTGARYLSAWDDDLRAEDKFWDDTHMVAASTISFTDALAGVLRADLAER